MVPAGYDLPPIVAEGCRRDTSAPAAHRRLSAGYESFTFGESVQPAPVVATVVGDGLMRSLRGSSFTNGPSNASSTRSNFTPICRASVHPALSYGRVGGAPGYLKSFGWSCGSNMSSTSGRNACADFTTYEPAG